MACKRQRAYFFASIISSERASFQDENCAGDAVTVARLRSRTAGKGGRKREL